MCVINGTHLTTIQVISILFSQLSCLISAQFYALLLSFTFLLLFCSFCAFRWFSSLFFFICSIFVVVGIGRGSGLDFGDPLWWKKLQDQVHGVWEAQDAKKWKFRVLALLLCSLQRKCVPSILSLSYCLPCPPSPSSRMRAPREQGQRRKEEAAAMCGRT